ncbi:hypothetical protein COOONC_26815 [Cooperia oncophora]
MRQIELPCGIEIDGERLQYLMFADDIVLIGSEPSALESSLNILSEASQSVGLVIHPGKTKWMKNNYTNDYRLCMKGSIIEEVSSFTYLGQEITMDNDLTREISRRRKAGWATFNKYRDVLTDIRIETQIRSQGVQHPCSTSSNWYKVEVRAWSTNPRGGEESTSLLIDDKGAMERAMCRVTLMHKIPAREIRRRTGVKDVIETIYDRKEMAWTT